MTSLQNGNYNSRSMNGLTTIYANDITTDVINAVDANVSNDLTVGDQAIINGLTKLYSDLLIYDKSSPTKFPYRFTTTGTSLFFSYDGTTPRALFDISLNTVSGFPELNMRRIMNLYNNFQLNNNLEFRLGTFGGSTYAFMKYTESTRNLSLVAGQGGGTVDSQFNLTTNTAAGSPFVLSFTPTQLTVPNNIDVVGTGLCRGVFFKGITGVGGALLNSGLISEVNNTILTYGINVSQLTTPRDNTVPGGFFRLDTRLSGSNTFFQIRQIRAGETTENIVFSTHNSTFLTTAHFGLRSNLQIEARQKINFYDITTPFTNKSDIYRNGASLIFESVNPNNQMVFNTADGAGVSAQSFLNSIATTTITSTNINLNGAVATTTNDITQTTGIISQSGAGTNLMKAITLNINTDLSLSGSGKINQIGTGVNAMGAITMNSDTDITQQGIGKIVQSSTAGINSMGAITLNANANLTMSGTGIVSQGGSGVNLMKNITLNVDNNFLQSGTGIITQSGTITTANTLKETVITGTSPITIYPRQPLLADPTTQNALVFSDNPAGTGRSGFFLQNASGSDLIQFGSNSYIFGNRNTAKPASYIRLDGRGGSNPLISFRIEDAGTTGISRIAYAIYDNTVAQHNFDNRFNRKVSLFDTITPFTASTDITKVGADLAIAGQNASSTLTISNRNASNVASNTFVSSTATTSITSTNINLNGTTTISNNTNFVLQDGSIQNTAYQEAELSDTYFHSKVSGRNILCSSFNMADNPNTGTFTGLGTTTYFFYPMKVVKNVSYTGVGILAGTTGTNNWEIALYQGFVNNPALLKTTGTVSSTGGVMNYYAFTGGAYVPTATDIVYVGLRNLTAGHSAYFLPANTYMSYASAPAMTNGTLNKRGQSTPGTVAFPANLGAGAVMTINTVLPYLVFYN